MAQRNFILLALGKAEETTCTFNLCLKHAFRDAVVLDIEETYVSTGLVNFPRNSTLGFSIIGKGVGQVDNGNKLGCSGGL
ncbi:hypothetical protein O987_12640 [Comamonas testosteroni TK102]|uniref:Uncharacterized protein n=1 Tax=Comamonas testosteroni TK102 TaxID=1392005 RepID=A0A076PPS5_COMTE|nr:hypothetical protein O987_12640 [Comamonas testosteroni TK102]